MMLIKVRATGAGREEVIRLADIFRGRILDVTNSTYIIEITGTDEKLDAFIKALDRKLILEVVRSGAIGVGRGEKAPAHLKEHRGDSHDHEHLLRQGCRSFDHPGQEDRRHRLWIPGPCPCQQSKGVGSQRDRGSAPRFRLPCQGEQCRPGGHGTGRGGGRSGRGHGARAGRASSGTLPGDNRAQYQGGCGTGLRPRVQHPLRAD